MSEPSTSKPASASASAISSVETRQTVQSLYNIDLVGRTAHRITDVKLPSNRQVLQVFFHNMRFVKLDAKDSAKLTLDAVYIFWQQARIVLFDIATADALKTIRIEEDKKFLIRQPGRPGCMIGCDMVLFLAEKRASERKEKEKQRKRKFEEMSKPKDSAAGQYTESSDEGEVEVMEGIDEKAQDVGEAIEESTAETCNIVEPQKSVQKRGRIHFLTPRLASALDHAKLTDPMAAHVLIACADALNYSVDELSIKRTTINRYRRENRRLARIYIRQKWYLSAEPMALAFFDSNVSLEQKRKMVERLAYDEPINKVDQNRAVSKPQTFANHSLSDFISNKTNNFFARFGLSPEFLKFDPPTWETNESFKEGRVFCKNLAVVNDTAERGVKFMKDYNRILTNKEDEKQFLLQVVEAYRKKYPSFIKTSLVNV